MTQQFVISLYNLAETCNYGNLKDETIWDRIVVSIRDQALPERLQTVAELTLGKAKTCVRQCAAVHKQQVALKSRPKEDKSTESLPTGKEKALKLTGHPPHVAQRASPQSALDVDTSLTRNNSALHKTQSAINAAKKDILVPGAIPRLFQRLST